MRKMMKNLAAALVLGTTVAGMAACGAKHTQPVGTASTSAQQTETSDGAKSDPKAKDVYKVGIVQFMDHPSLNQIAENVEKELDAKGQELGVDFNYRDYTFNGQGDATVLGQIASQLTADQVDLIIPIATPAAQVVQTAVDGEIPLVFSAVTDPVGAKLAAAMDAPGANITGTSDALNTNAIMDLILALKPDTDYVGLLYSKSEDSSKQAIADAKAYLDQKGIRYIEKTGTTNDEVSSAAEALIAEGVDAVFTPTDNTIQNAELGIFEKFADAKIPHFGGADSFALNGAFCGYGVDYAQLGTATGDLAVKILTEGADPATTAVETFDNGIAVINTDTCASMGLDLQAVKDAFAPYCTEIKETKTAQEF